MNPLWILVLLPLAWALGGALGANDLCRQLKAQERMRKRYGEELVRRWAERAKAKG